MNQAYAGLADWFEYLNSDCDYDSWSQYLYERLRSLGVAGGRGLEIGCGSGRFCRDFARRGFDMTGYDVSPAMLAKAEQLSAKEGVFPHYILSDARKIKTLGGRADFALCVNDCVNYLPQADIPRFFARVAGCLKKGGTFLFDVSSAYKLREVLGNNSFCEDREEVAYMWFNTLHADRVEMDFTLFVRGEDGRFSREDERHVQYIHEEDDLRRAAEGAGFSVRAVEGASGDSSDKMRQNFLCVRA